MAGSFLDTLSAEEKQRIRDRTDTLIELLEKWIRQYPFIRTTRIPTIALVTATALPWMSVSDVLTAAKVLFWIFGVDDKVDERIFTLAEIRRKADQWYSIANHGPTNERDDNDELTAILLEIRKGLSKSHLFEPLREYWSNSVRCLIEAMIQECQYRLQYNAYGACALPPLDEYLHNDSVGMYLWQSAVLILLRDSSVIEHFESINEAINYAGAAVRLYNDVRTFDREIQEGGINAILILYHTMLNGDPNTTKGNVLTKAKQYVLHLADSYAQRYYNLAGQLETDSGQFEETTSRMLAFHAHFYGYSEHDYHTTSLAEAYQMLNGSTS